MLLRVVDLYTLGSEDAANIEKDVFTSPKGPSFRRSMGISLRKQQPVLLRDGWLGIPINDVLGHLRLLHTRNWRVVDLWL